MVKNSSFRGACTYHLRFEGAREVIIDAVEIAGFKYGNGQVRCGGGIFINNGDDRPGKYKVPRGQYTPTPNNLTYFAITNSWFHDNLDEEQRQNVDGVLVHSGAHGLISNCRFENWLKGDSALDVSHRRLDRDYDKKLIRVERNIFTNCRFIKSVGRANPGCHIIWSNNVLTDTALADYHQGYEVIHCFEDIIFTKPSFRLMALWGLCDGSLRINRCLFILPQNKAYLHQGAAGTPKDYTWVSSDYNIFFLGNQMHWVLGHGISINDFNSWQATGNDTHSLLYAINPEVKNASKATARDLSKQLSPIESSRTYTPVTDFLGKQRGTGSYVGAFLPK